MAELLSVPGAFANPISSCCIHVRLAKGLRVASATSCTLPSGATLELTFRAASFASACEKPIASKPSQKTTSS